MLDIPDENNYEIGRYEKTGIISEAQETTEAEKTFQPDLGITTRIVEAGGYRLFRIDLVTPNYQYSGPKLALRPVDTKGNGIEFVPLSDNDLIGMNSLAVDQLELSKLQDLLKALSTLRGLVLAGVDDACVSLYMSTGLRSGECYELRIIDRIMGSRINEASSTIHRQQLDIFGDKNAISRHQQRENNRRETIRKNAEEEEERERRVQQIRKEIARMTVPGTLRRDSHERGSGSRTIPFVPGVKGAMRTNEEETDAIQNARDNNRGWY